MGQYGAFGYATGRSGGPWDHATILNHFYGGTTVGHINDNPLMAVLLKARKGQAMVVYRAAGLQVQGIAGQRRPPCGPRCDPTGSSTCRPARTASTPTPTPAVQLDGPVRVKAAPDSGTTALRLCKSDGSAVAYRGELVAFGRSFDGSKVGAETVNLVAMDELMRGVVPRESPASWGDADGGRGMAALRAQAVAARSYAAAGDTRWGDLHSGLGARATTCDDTFCQVYGGAATVSSAGTVTALTDPRTDQAVAETAGEVRIRNGAVARTEFSSSTGGWTAGGTFPAVVDQGDAVSTNPNHSWATSVARSKIESAYGARHPHRHPGARSQRPRRHGRPGRHDPPHRHEPHRRRHRQPAAVGAGPEVRLVQHHRATAARRPSRGRSTRPARRRRCRRARSPTSPPTARTACAIDCVAWRDIAEGTGGGRFSPAGLVTRAQMASFVARLIVADGGSLPVGAPGRLRRRRRLRPRARDQPAGGRRRRARASGPAPTAPAGAIDRAQVASILARAVKHLGRRPRRHAHRLLHRRRPGRCTSSPSTSSPAKASSPGPRRASSRRPPAPDGTRWRPWWRGPSTSPWRSERPPQGAASEAG